MDKHLNPIKFFLTSVVIYSSFIDANLLKLDCTEASLEYTQNSTFSDNLRILLSSLSSNTSLYKGFYNSSSGNDTNQVYGQSLCRGDTDNKTCQDCLEKAAEDILKNCSREDATIWYDLCQIRYSSQYFFAIYTGYHGKFPDSNSGRGIVNNPIRRQEALTYLMDNITSQASTDSLRFAVGTVEYGSQVHCLAQCTRDIKPGDCQDCLSTGSSELIKKFGNREGGIMVDWNCYLRFDMYQFFNSSSTILLTYSSSGKVTVSWVRSILYIDR